ncbi:MULTISPECIES: MaoC family dehydratase [Pseudomonas]|uniref:MaoC family dehydratase n=1 Tax=Pseudomonas TaxID=286 RepID=UPI001E4DE2D4|nr:MULTISPECIES: MaoC family dehydratase [Pseudomonas]EKT4502775.1 MaoC family dehydratase N-terminal domain-containing protein [Pseudomonas putida]MCK1156660.1 MaoC family dehydratase N-terminal domain-containing protein [Pseudomonas aeruginosa]MDM3893844.1 MaoC/PaaZ C-terminal domain-containing protein [Pseudomonas juntendi]
MPIEVEKLLSYPIPEVRQRLTREQTAFYALSVGLGADPMDERQLRFVDYRRDLRALPSLALVLGHPGFWLGDERSGVNPRHVVHGEQELTLHAELPVEGEVIGETRVVGVVDKGPGQGALLYIRKEVREAQDGQLLATALNTIFVRGGGGFGGDSQTLRPSRAQPEGEPDWFVDLPTRPEQALYYRMNGDDNPLHADPSVASASGFSQPILHGLCTFGVVGHALVKALADYDAGLLRSMALRFSAPVLPGETIRTEIWRDGAFRARVLERDTLVVTHGQATFASESAR